MNNFDDPFENFEISQDKTMRDQFENIIEDDEIIIEVIKPVKSRYYKNLLLPWIIPIFWIHAIFILVISCFSLPFLYAKGYKNLCYAYTNKRLIVRKGWVGVDYVSLEYKDVTATGVNVSFLDKKTKTGTLSFSSPSTNNSNSIKFAHIANPYEKMKEIKKIIKDNQPK